MTNKLPNPNNSTPRWFLVVVCLVPLVLIGLHRLTAQDNPPQDTQSQPLQAEKPAVKDPAAAAITKQAAETLREARTRLENYESLKADLLETVLIGARRFQAKGTYLHARGNKVRQEFRLTVEGADGKPLEGSLLQVSDGKLMHSSHHIGDQQQIFRRDVKNIFAAIEKYPSIKAELLRAKLGIGGLPALLASLEQSFRFTEYKMETIQDSEYVMIGGSWKENYRKRMRPSNAGPDTPLPPYVPDHVRVYFDKQSLFPRRVFYFKNIDNKLRPMLTLDFLDVMENVSVTDKDFDYYPPEGIVPTDITQDTIEAIIKSAQSQEQKSQEEDPPHSESSIDKPPSTPENSGN